MLDANKLICYAGLPHLLCGLVTAGLPEGCVAPYIDGKWLSRPAGLPHDAPWEVLLNGAPAMHPGDLHKMRVEYPTALREMIFGTDGGGADRRGDQGARGGASLERNDRTGVRGNGTALGHEGGHFREA